MLVVSVESPPGGGKGFLLKHLASRGLQRIALQDDAIHHMMDMNTDGARWAFFTELFFLSMHVQAYLKAAAGAGPGAVVLLEGSPVSDRLCYYQKQHRARMHPLEAELYDTWWALLEPLWRVDHHVLLLSDVHSHLERIIDNAKVEQANIGLPEIHTMIATYAAALPQAYVLSCPANFEDNEPVLENLRATLQALLRSMALEQQQQQQRLLHKHDGDGPPLPRPPP